MTAQQINIPLLRKSVEWVEEQAERPVIDREWNQRMYVGSPYMVASRMLMANTDAHLEYLQTLAPHCGTAYCVAGKIGADHEDAFKHCEFAKIDGQNVHVSDYAREKLGISLGQAGLLFRANNSAADVRRIAEQIAGERL